MLFLGLLDKLKYYILTLVIFMLCAVALKIYIDNEKTEAVERVKVAIEQAVNEKIKNDTETVIEAYLDNPTINELSDGMLSRAAKKADSDSRLLGTQSDTRTPDGSETRASVGASDELLDQEVNFILSNPDLLQ